MGLPRPQQEPSLSEKERDKRRVSGRQGMDTEPSPLSSTTLSDQLRCRGVVLRSQTAVLPAQGHVGTMCDRHYSLVLLKLFLMGLAATDHSERL